MPGERILIGNFGDNSWLLWESIKLKYGLYNDSYLGIYGFKPSAITEPFIYGPFLLSSYIFDGIVIWNFFVILLLSLTFISSLLLFKKLNFNNYVSYGLSFLFVLSPYFSFHSRDHLTLLAGFLIPTYVYLVIKNLSLKNLLLMNVFLLISLGVSNYIGVFLAFLNFLLSFYLLFKDRNKFTLLNVLVTSLFVFLLSVGIKIYSPQSSRDIDNFLIFSFKPWNLLIQPERALFDINPIGRFFEQHRSIYFQYFETEHSAYYFGIMLSIVVLYIILFKGSNLNPKMKFLFICTLLFSLPPYFSIQGVKIYTPSYIFFILFDQFRVITRMGIISFFLILTFVGHYLSSFTDYKKQKLFLGLLFIFTVLEIYVPLKLSIIKNNYESIYSYIRVVSSKDSNIILYPYQRSTLVFSDMKFFQRKVINPPDYQVNDFESKNFTENLSCYEIKKFYLEKKDLYLLDTKNLVQYSEVFNSLSKVLEEKDFNLYKVDCR